MRICRQKRGIDNKNYSNADKWNRRCRSGKQVLKQQRQPVAAPQQGICVSEYLVDLLFSGQTGTQTESR